MTTEILYQGTITKLSFNDWQSAELYLLKWISKPISMTIYFEEITDQITYFQDVQQFCSTIIRAQQSEMAHTWKVHVYGFDRVEHTVELAA